MTDLPSARILLLSLVTVAACVRDTSKASGGAADSSRLDSVRDLPGVHARSKGAPLDTAGAGAINWTLAALQSRLRDAGLDAVAAGEVRQPFMGGTGMRYKLPGGELQAFIYADADAVARDTDVLDTVNVSPPAMMISWAMPPKLIVSNNLAIILLTRDASLRQKVRLAVKPDRPSHTKSF